MKDNSGKLIESIMSVINENTPDTKIMYRSEEPYGSGVRDILDIMTFEIYENGNIDILEYVSEHYMDNKTRQLITKFIMGVEAGSVSEDETYEFCKELIEKLNTITHHNLKYALWLAEKDTVSGFYCQGYECPEIDAYYVSDVILSDLGYDGILFAYDDEPEPIDELNELTEAFRDYDDNIGAVEDELYDLITSVDMFNNNIDTLTYDFDFHSDKFYDDDVQRGKKLQARLQKLYDLRQKEYEQEINELPPKTNKTSFEGFDITQTDPPYDSYMLEGNKDREYIMKKEGFTDVYIAEMTPDEYILLCGKYGWGKTFDNVDDILNSASTDKERIREYAERFKKGEKAPMPVLNVKHQGQEGRHRAFAAKLAGIKTIPVLIEV